MKRFLLIFFSLLVCFLILTACAEPSDGLPYWSEAKEYELKRAYNAYQYGVEFDPDSVLLTYFGTYGGYEAVRDVGLGGAIAWAPEIGGHVFAYGNSNGIHRQSWTAFMRCTAPGLTPIMFRSATPLFRPADTRHILAGIF